MKNNLLQETSYKQDLVKTAATRVVPGDIDPEELDHLLEQRDGLVRAKRGFLPMEEESSGKVIEVIRDLESQVARLQRRQRIVEFSKGEYQILLPEVLKWRRADTMLPTFGIFRPDVPNFGFIATAGRPRGGLIDIIDARFRQTDGRVQLVPSMPKIIVDCYRDIIKSVDEHAQAKLAAMSNADNVEVRLTARFHGFLPGDVKEEIVKAVHSRLFRMLYVIAEVEEWKWNSIVTSRQGDPILVGFDGEELWRMKVFDTTSAEQLIADEYSVKAV